MSTEEQARRHFLEEAETYFENIETVILNLNASDQRIQDLDLALRSAHSVKGTAAMMGFMPLSHLAHRIEDYFKILRARNLPLETDVETLLLQGLDGLRAVRQRLYDGQSVDEEWSTTQFGSIFGQLHHRLGDLTPEDETSLLSAEAEVDVSVLVFSNGVEEYLDQLESKRSHLSGEALRQELATGASQLLDYGLMAEMGAFIEVCQSVLTYSSMVADADLDAFADRVIQTWQRSHSLVLLGRTEQLPTSLDVSALTLNPVEDENPNPTAPNPTEATPISTPTSAPPLEALHHVDDVADTTTALPEQPIDDTTLADDITADDLSQLTAQLAQLDLDNLAPDGFVPDVPEPAPAPGFHVVTALASPNDPIDRETTEPDAKTDSGPAKGQDDPFPELDPSELLALAETLDGIDLPDPSILITEPTATEADRHVAPPSAPPQAAQSSSITSVVDAINLLLGDVQSARLPIAELAQPQDTLFSTATPASAPQPTETSVRVPVSQLHAINQLLSSLLLDRNAINLRVEQLNTFSELLKQRVGEIDSFNTQLRQWYDRTSIDSLEQTPSTPASTMQGFQDDTLTYPDLSSGIATLALSRIQTNMEQQMQGFDTLEMDQYSDLHLLAQDQMETIVKLQEVAADIDLGVQDIKQAAGRLNYTSRSLQDQVSRTQMRPFEDIVGRFPRLIRDLSVQYGKQVNLTIEGSNTLFERYALDRLTDPLIHLLRNAFDHGIEAPEVRQQQGKSTEGHIQIRATNRGNRAVISISDDGKGIDLDKIRDRVRNYGIPDEQIQDMSRQELLSVIFEPGFSTAEHVTDLSGRGVGMDVVRSNLQPIKGDIQVDTTLGQGTTFTMTIPLSLSVVRVMILEYHNMVFALTTDDVQEMIQFNPEASSDPHQPGMMRWRDRSIPLIQLEDYFQFNSRIRSMTLDGTPTIDRPIVVIVGDKKTPYGLLLQRFWKEQDVVMQPMATPIPLPAGFSGATVLGDGRIIPLMDSQQFGTLVAHPPIPIEQQGDQKIAANQPARVSSRREEQIASSTPLVVDPVHPIPSNTPDIIDTPTILVVDDSIHARRYLAISLEKAGYLTEQAKDGQDAIDQLNACLQVQAIICDVEMPRMDGYGVLDTLRNQPQFQTLPILMLTSRSSDKHRKLAMNLGASAYFSKPYNEQELLQTLASLV